MDDAAALAEIRRAAQATIDAWPEAKAAVLFGSRARGNHRPDSDWDVAFITVGDSERLGTVPDGLPFGRLDVGQYVNEFTISERLVEREALCIGHVSHGIVRDGRILAGDWARPETKGKPFMKAEKYERFMRVSIGMIEKAISAMSRTGASGNWPNAPTVVDDFVACTADAAEHLAKAMLGRHGVDARFVHDVHALATQARAKGHANLADDMVRMNGRTKQDHGARYESSDSEGLRHAIHRLPVVIDLLERELTVLPVNFVDAETRTNLIRTTVDVLVAGASGLRDAAGRDGSGMEPPRSLGWLKPLLDMRESLPPKIERTAKRLRQG